MHPDLLQPIEVQETADTASFIVKQKLHNKRYEERRLELCNEGIRIVTLFSHVSLVIHIQC